MAAYFFDSSAIVKRYLKEQGTSWVIGITDPAKGNSIYVARIAGVEVVSAIARQGQRGNLLLAGVSTVMDQFRQDFANQYRIVAITPALLDQAAGLAERHALRAYDAVQPAAATQAQARRHVRRLKPLNLVSSDEELNAAAVQEGLTVQDPNSFP